MNPGFIGVLALASLSTLAQAAAPEACNRACLEGYVDRYLNAMEANVASPYLFAPGTKFTENGIKTTNNPQRDPATGQTVTRGCRKQFEESLKGIVFAFGFFDHENINWTWQLAELFKIEDGQIRRIEAVFLRGPYGINSGWSTFEQGMSEGAREIK